MVSVMLVLAQIYELEDTANTTSFVWTRQLAVTGDLTRILMIEEMYGGLYHAARASTDRDEVESAQAFVRTKSPLLRELGRWYYAVITRASFNSRDNLTDVELNVLDIFATTYAFVRETQLIPLPPPRQQRVSAPVPSTTPASTPPRQRKVKAPVQSTTPTSTPPGHLRALYKLVDSKKVPAQVQSTTPISMSPPHLQAIPKSVESTRPLSSPAPVGNNRKALIPEAIPTAIESTTPLSSPSSVGSEFKSRIPRAVPRRSEGSQSSRSTSSSSGRLSSSPSRIPRLIARAKVSTPVNYYQSNPKSRLDVAVGKIINDLPVHVSFRHAKNDEWYDESGHYWVGSEVEAKHCFLRILPSGTVMVRVGGGWQELSAYILKNFGSPADKKRTSPRSSPLSGRYSTSTPPNAREMIRPASGSLSPFH